MRLLQKTEELCEIWDHSSQMGCVYLIVYLASETSADRNRLNMGAPRKMMSRFYYCPSLLSCLEAHGHGSLPSFNRTQVRVLFSSVQQILFSIIPNLEADKQTITKRIFVICR